MKVFEVPSLSIWFYIYCAMTTRTLQDCRDTILRKSGWFSRKDTDEKVRCLEGLMEFGGFDELSIIFTCLRDDHSMIRNKASETFLFFWKKAESQIVKEVWFRGLPFDNELLDYFRIDFDHDTFLSLIRIASLNRSGFVREKSVTELGRLHSQENLKFILLRLGEWVAQVRDAAITAIRTYLAPEYVNWLLETLPLIDQLLDVQRVDLAAIHDEILQFILTHASIDDINAVDDAKRLRYYRYFIKRCNIDESLAIQIFADSNFLIRLLVLNHSSELGRQFQQRIVRLALKDRSTLVKIRALNAARQFFAGCFRRSAAFTIG